MNSALRAALLGPLLCDPAHLAPWLRRAGAIPAKADDMEGEDTYTEGAPLPPPAEETYGPVRVIPITGAILQGCSAYDIRRGAACDPRHISLQLRQAIADHSVRAILFHVSSPGGAVTGIPELAADIAASPKPTAAWTGDLCCSAAYWLASQCGALWATPSATLAAVGVWTAHLDLSGMMEMAGIRAEIIRSAPLKAAGALGTALSADQRANIQASVGGLHAQFKSAILRRRPLALPSALQGQTLLGSEAAASGLVTALLRDLPSAIAKLTASPI